MRCGSCLSGARVQLNHSADLPSLLQCCEDIIGFRISSEKHKDVLIYVHCWRVYMSVGLAVLKSYLCPLKLTRLVKDFVT